MRRGGGRFTPHHCTARLRTPLSLPDELLQPLGHVATRWGLDSVALVAQVHAVILLEGENHGRSKRRTTFTLHEAAAACRERRASAQAFEGGNIHVQCCSRIAQSKERVPIRLQSLGAIDWFDLSIGLLRLLKWQQRSAPVDGHHRLFTSAIVLDLRIVTIERKHEGAAT